MCRITNLLRVYCGKSHSTTNEMEISHIKIPLTAAELSTFWNAIKTFEISNNYMIKWKIRPLQVSYADYLFICISINIFSVPILRTFFSIPSTDNFVRILPEIKIFSMKFCVWTFQYMLNETFDNRTIKITDNSGEINCIWANGCALQCALQSLKSQSSNAIRLSPVNKPGKLICNEFHWKIFYI